MNLAIAFTPARDRAARLWRDYPREALALALLGATTALAFAGSAWSTPSLEGIRAIRGDSDAPPAPPPLILRQVAPQDAVAINSALPLADGPNPAAKAFRMRSADMATYGRALECLTSAVYYEAGQESTDGQKAVAQVVLNRVRHPAFPASVCAVVYQGSTRATGCQFTFTCDGSLARGPDAFHWARARKIAEAALKGEVYKPVGYATHYHANYVVPYWAPTLAKNAVIGAHIFYRWSGGWGRPPAFTQRYAAAEPNTAALRSAALAAEAQQVAQLDVEELLEEIPGAEAGKPAEGRVAIRFNLAAARKAVEEAPRMPYVEKMAASDTLRWSLSGGIVAEQEKQKPLGKPEPVIGEVASGTSDE